MQRDFLYQDCSGDQRKKLRCDIRFDERGDSQQRQDHPEKQRGDLCEHRNEPNIFIANALARYPKRKATEGRIIYLEQEVARRIGEAPMYYGGDMRKVTSAINVQHAHQANQAKETKAM